MGVREDIICDDFKTVPVPYLNAYFEYEDINCTGHNMNGDLKIFDLDKCEGSYGCTSWDEEENQEISGDYGDYGIPRMTSTTRCGIDPELFSHCSQCKICRPRDFTKIQVRYFINIFTNVCCIRYACSLFQALSSKSNVY